MSYTDWAPAAENFIIHSTDSGAAQPDGGAYEDCTVMRVDAAHSTANWHDIPCSLGKRIQVTNTTVIAADVINGYVCKMDASSYVLSTAIRSPLYENIVHEDKERILQKADDDRYFVCKNLEVISIVFRCDGEYAPILTKFRLTQIHDIYCLINIGNRSLGIPNCRDGTDELYGCSPLGYDCLESQFRCANGRCVSIGAYCDFIDVSWLNLSRERKTKSIFLTNELI